MNNDLVWRKKDAERQLDTIEEKLDRVSESLERLNLANTRIVGIINQITPPMVKSMTGNLRYIW